MKAKVFAWMAATLMFSSTPGLAQNKGEAPMKEELKPQKILIAYFTHSGNTRTIAGFIREETGGELFEIQPKKPYPSDYDTVVAQAKEELKADQRPELKSKVMNVADYDVVFVGSPNWWGTVAPPVMTFLTGHDLSKKKIVPFITHEGSRMGKSASDVQRLCPKSTVLKGLPVRGSSVDTARAEVNAWLRKLGMVK